MHLILFSGSSVMPVVWQVSALRLEKPVYGRSEDFARLLIVVLHGVVFVFYIFV